MPTVTSKENKESAIRELINGLTDAIGAKDIEKAMQFYAPDTLIFGMSLAL